ncbi:MAG: NAD-dependent epimerase/dehydratase family protein [Flavobacteriales bacterium]
MIVGRGLIATAFENAHLPSDALIFASGVSNSKETDPNQFQRELDLLIKTILENTDKRFVYFSTASVLDAEMAGEPYVIHKLQCESIIQMECERHLILRVTNVVGNTGNPHTVFKFFVDHIRSETSFELWTRACRNLVDIDDVVRIVLALLSGDVRAQTFLLANPTNHAVLELVQRLEHRMNKRAHYTEVNRGSCMHYDLTETRAFYEANHFSFPEDYLEKLIDRYLSF